MEFKKRLIEFYLFLVLITTITIIINCFIILACRVLNIDLKASCSRGMIGYK